MTLLKFCSCVVLLTCFLCGCVMAHPEKNISSNPAERRRVLIDSFRQGKYTMPQLASALNDEDKLVKRSAIRLLTEVGKPAADIMRSALMNSDYAVRRTALLGLERAGAVTLEDLAMGITDDHELVRLETVRILSNTQSKSPRVKELMTVASNDNSILVREEVLTGFFKVVEKSSLREKYMDRTIEIVHSFKLPASGWKFMTDNDRRGHFEEWYATDYKDHKWHVIGIEKAWQSFGYEYTGVAWYRGRFDMPDRLDCDGIEVYFEGVDESAWIWVNGEYAGYHDIGPSGWDKPFSLDITDAVKWKEENHITVRVMNTLAAGGIWMPITVNFLKVR